MELIETKIEGVFIIENFKHSDHRGTFTKTFNRENFESKKINFEVKESYYTVSKKHTIRGMHFQLPPYDHDKLVYVAQGEALDVIIDLRTYSSTYGEVFSVNLSEKNHKSIFIPKGLAHGFLSLEDNTIMIYNVSSEYNPEADSGILFDSFNFEWNVENPLLSSRDQSFVKFEEFVCFNPFNNKS